MPRIDLNSVPVNTASRYPGFLAAKMAGRGQRALGRAAGLTQFGVNLVTLAPGAMSALRHWHERQDEFVMVTHGTCTLIDGHGHHALEARDCAAFPAWDANGHHIVNLSASEAAFLVVGTHTLTEIGHYSDVDTKVTFDKNGFNFTRCDGTPVNKGDG